MNNIGINLKMSSILLKINEIIQENQKYIKYQIYYFMDHLEAAKEQL